MALLIKLGVEFIPAGAGARIIEVLHQISQETGKDLTITSGSDGIHSGPLDPHVSGEAFDVRVKGMTPKEVSDLVATISRKLGSRFYAFHESPGTDNAHIHIQRTKGTTYSFQEFVLGK